MAPGLDSDLRQYGLRHPDFAAVLRDAARAINAIAQTSANEATISAAFDTQLAMALQRIGVEYAPVKEQGLSLGAKRLRGRIDSRVGDVIIEFKQPSTFNTPRLQEAATRQVTAYAHSLFADDGRTVAAYVTDGVKAKRLIVNASGTFEGPLRPLDGDFLLEYAQAVVSTTLRALSGENLVKHFTGSTASTKELATVLYNELASESAVGRTQMLFQEWQLLFKLAHDDTSKQQAILDRRSALEDAVGVSLDESSFLPDYRALFALQTAYSIVLKCIGMGVLQGVTQFRPSSDLASVAMADRATTQRFLEAMEDGSEVRDRGVENLLEGDFFSWYAQSDQFTPVIHRAVQPVLQDIAEFEALPAFHGDRVAARDLFKDFYMHMIPEKVRHSLGEYYTPSWLADDTINQAIEQLSTSDAEAWRLLDPTCGSGTFLTMGMQKILDETHDLPLADRLDSVLQRIVGIDLNPLAVLTARMNYFINISPLLGDRPAFHIPVYLGDASVTPEPTVIDGVDCLSYSIRTLQQPLQVTMPRSALRDVAKFTTEMARVEFFTKARDRSRIQAALLALVAEDERTEAITSEIGQLADQLVELEEREWNGIWPRIIADFLTTGAIGKFEIVVGNPPWIDWKNLPENYRRSLVELCIERDIFSGDGVTGGINLNVCALIALTAAENWLAPGGALAMLMPDTLLFQQSYEGFRRLKTGPSGDRIYLSKLTDWQKAGHPFKPVQQKFFTYVFLSEKPADWPGVAVRELHKARTVPLPDPSTSYRFSELPEDLFVEKATWAEPIHAGKSYFSRGASAPEVHAFAAVAGESPYRGREGIEFYPQELLLFEYVGPGSTPTTAKFRNYQSPNSKHRIPAMTRELETSVMRPLIKGPMISRFGIKAPQFYVPFYYSPDFATGRSPLPLDRLMDEYPQLARLLVAYRNVFESQTQYNQRIIGETHSTEFYAVARVGAYSHASNYVCFRDNTKWGASVLSDVATPWGTTTKPVFQNHAVSISERPDGAFISLDEAHYICAVLNSTLVSNFVIRSSEAAVVQNSRAREHPNFRLRQRQPRSAGRTISSRPRLK
ncbi:N-6 DNA methylase (plasmid) [Frigoribacterium sp. NBH87]|uniref:Eco57I restriction-modification methylase domain-containing protein n=1 Tax=Frigoribacterium sp. NBH87 TaxID=2596916 RepID=UPI0016292E65|nr:N-6 DNA methylase [Frigoribacterium sp. NBH87]QNE45429.1 N-6 DNA methylase [Frigoribacterium sp. NBH87]